MECLGDLEYHLILTKLEAEDIARASCVNHKLRISASEDSLWSQICATQLNLSIPIDHLGNPIPSFKECYRIWRESFSMYPWLLVKRVKRSWGGLRNWLMINFPESEATLCKGASEAEIQELERILNVKLPLPTRILYRFFDGQDLSKTHTRSPFGSPLGIIGGYTFYDRTVNVYLLPIHEIILRTKDIRTHPGLSGKPNHIVVAASSTYINKTFLLNCSSGQLYVGTKNLSTAGEMLPCVPNESIRLANSLRGDELQDAMLLWLEEHARRLESGFIKLREGKKNRCISLFPEELPSCSTAITSGVKVRASAVLIPEFSDLQDYEDKYFFTYSIRMSLLPEGCIINGITYPSCQLYWRHWIISANGRVISDINAEAVIGKFPLLLPGQKEFVYESCTPLPCADGSIEGFFTFIPGRLSEPKDDPFRVEVAQFPLKLPDYIF